MDIANTLFSIEKRAAESIKAAQGDYYGDDGLLVCGKCNTPKQVRVMILDKERTPFCLCKCEVEKRDREEAERKRQEQARQIQEMRRVGFPDDEMKNWTFERDDGKNAKVTNVLRNYVSNFEEMRENGKGLLLFGSVGTGKTFGAACVANALIDKGFPCLVTNFARLVNAIWETKEKQAYIDGLNRFSLLVIDDFASERDAGYMNENVYNIINGRYLAGLPLIVTTNLTADELKSPADIWRMRIYSRLLEMTIPLEVKGEDRRRERLRNDHKRYADMLGL